MKPPCFPSEQQWGEWRTSARLTGVGLDGFCTDCTPEYKAEMIAVERCAHQKTEFEPDEDGIITGIRHKDDKPVRKPGSGGTRPATDKRDMRRRENRVAKEVV